MHTWRDEINIVEWSGTFLRRRLQKCGSVSPFQKSKALLNRHEDFLCITSQWMQVGYEEESQVGLIIFCVPCKIENVSLSYALSCQSPLPTSPIWPHLQLSNKSKLKELNFRFCHHQSPIYWVPNFLALNPGWERKTKREGGREGEREEGATGSCNSSAPSLPPHPSLMARSKFKVATV